MLNKIRACVIDLRQRDGLTGNHLLSLVSFMNECKDPPGLRDLFDTVWVARLTKLAKDLDTASAALATPAVASATAAAAANTGPCVPFVDAQKLAGQLASRVSQLITTVSDKTKFLDAAKQATLVYKQFVEKTQLAHAELSQRHQQHQQHQHHVPSLNLEPVTESFKQCLSSGKNEDEAGIRDAAKKVAATVKQLMLELAKLQKSVRQSAVTAATTTTTTTLQPSTSSSATAAAALKLARSASNAALTELDRELHPASAVEANAATVERLSVDQAAPTAETLAATARGVVAALQKMKTFPLLTLSQTVQVAGITSKAVFLFEDQARRLAASAPTGASSASTKLIADLSASRVNLLRAVDRWTQSPDSGPGSSGPSLAAAVNNVELNLTAWMKAYFSAGGKGPPPSQAPAAVTQPSPPPNQRPSSTVPSSNPHAMSNSHPPSTKSPPTSPRRQQQQQQQQPTNTSSSPSPPPPKKQPLPPKKPPPTSPTTTQQATTSKPPTTSSSPFSSAVASSRGSSGVDDVIDGLELDDDGNVKSGSVDALIQCLYANTYSTPDFISAFLLTHQTFVSSADLIDRLIAAYDGLVSAGRKAARIRLFNCLRKWVEDSADVAQFPDVGERVLQFVESAPVKTNDESLALMLRLKYFQRLASDDDQQAGKAQFSTPPPQPLLTKTGVRVRPSSVEPLELARQLCLIDFADFSHIAPSELLESAWTKADRKERSPHVCRLTDRFNALSRWVTVSLMQESQLRTRAALLKRFVKLGDELVALNNFHSAFAVVGALSHAAVYRLKRTWNELSEDKLSRFARLEKICAAHKSYQMYRQQLHQANPPCVPYLGVYQTDLIFMQEGNPSRLGPDKVLVNFAKCRMVASVIRELSTYQHLGYNLQPVSSIQRYILQGADFNENHVSDDELFKKSLQLEPREPQQ